VRLCEKEEVKDTCADMCMSMAKYKRIRPVTG
jgi:hypothetical protein